MSATRNKVLSALVAFAVFFTMVFAAGAVGQESYAAVQKIEKKMEWCTYYPKASAVYNEYWIADTNEYTFNMSKCKSSNSKVAVVRKTSYGSYSVRFKKAGKATLTVYAKAKGAKTYKKHTIKVKATKYVNPVKSFKVGGKNLTAKFTKVDYYGSYKTIKGKLNITPKSGWEIDSITLCDMNTDKEKTVKNHSTVTIGPDKYLSVVYMNKKSGKFAITTVTTVTNFSKIEQ